MPTASHHKLPLAPLFMRLELADFTISPADRLRAWKVLGGLGKESLGDPARVKYLLAPILTRSAAEQQTFYDIFDQYWTELQQPLQASKPTKAKQPWWLRWLLLGLLVLGCIYGYYRLVEREIVDDPIAIYIDGPTNGVEGDSIRFSNQSEWTEEGSDISWRWQLEDAASQEVLLADSSHLDWNFVMPAVSDTGSHLRTVRLRMFVPEQDTVYEESLQVSVNCSQEPRVLDINLTQRTIETGDRLRFTVSGPAEDFERDRTKPSEPFIGIAQNWLFEWDFGDGSPIDTASNFAFHSYAENGQYTVYLTVTDTTATSFCQRSLAKTVKVGTEEVFLAQLDLHEDRITTLAIWGLGYYLLLAALGLGIIFHWVRWFTRRQRQEQDEDEPAHEEALAARFAHSDKAPYYLPLQDQSFAIRYDSTLVQLADAMRLRQQGLRKEIDVPTTLKTTVDKGGYPSLQFRFASQASEFLVLIDEQNRASHLGDLFKYLVHNLRAQDVNIELYYFRKYPDRFWNHYFPQGKSLSQLQRSCPDHKLVIFGDAHELIDPHNREQLAIRPLAASTFKQWKQCYLITPVPPVSWSYREQLLSRLFHVFPADIAGLQAWSNHLQQELEVRPDASQFLGCTQTFIQERQDADTEHRSWRRWKNVKSYLEAYGSELERWFMALAVFPVPSWELTIAIGRALGIEVTYDKLLYLARIPVLQTERFPEKLRQQLLDRISVEDERKARAAVQQELQAVKLICADSHVHQDLETALAIQEFALTPRDNQAKDAIRFLLKTNLLSPGQEAELDHLAAQSIAGPPTKGSPKRTSVREWLSDNSLDLRQETREERQDRINDLRLAVLLTLGYLALLLLGWQLGATDTLYRWAFKENPTERVQLSEKPLRKHFFVTEQAIIDSAIIYNNQGVEQALGTTPPDTFASHYFASALSTANPLIHGHGDEFQGQVVNYALANANWSKMYFNTATALQNGYVQGDIGQGLLDTALLLLGRAYRSDSTTLEIWHARGVIHYYNGLPDSSEWYYELLDSLDYFSGTVVQPNLSNLVGRARSSIVGIQAVPLAEQALEVNVDYYQNSSVDQQLELVVTPIGSGRQPEPQRQLLDAAPSTQKIVFTSPGREGRLQRLSVQLINPTNRNIVDTKEEAFSHSWLLSPPPRGNTDTEPPEQQTSNTSPITAQIPANGYRFQVLDQKTLKPLEGVDVQIAYSIARNRTATVRYTTNEEGFFSVNRSRLVEFLNGEFEVTTVFEGYDDSRESYQIEGIRSRLKEGEIIKILLKENIRFPYLVNIPGGSFQMGSDERIGKSVSSSSPAHKVTLTGFAISSYEITFAQYDQFCEATGREKPKEYHHDGRGEHPVINVSWNDAVAYCNWLSAEAGYLPYYETVYSKLGEEVTIPDPNGRGYRLPTEAEWEYAARSSRGGQSDFRYAGSNELDEVGWYANNSGDRTYVVGRKAPNGAGLYDMSGNVWEWVEDNYYDYSAEAQTNPRHEPVGRQRMLRGGAYLQQAEDCTVFVRQYRSAVQQQIYIGFRVARYTGRG